MAVTARGRTVTILRACACPATCLWPPSNRLCRLQSKLTTLSFTLLHKGAQEVHKKNIIIRIWISIMCFNDFLKHELCAVRNLDETFIRPIKKKYPRFNIFLARSLKKKSCSTHFCISLWPPRYIQLGQAPPLNWWHWQTLLKLRRATAVCKHWAAWRHPERMPSL